MSETAFNLLSTPRVKDSFGDRIYDDLCEDILQWLAIEDKLKFSQISKQFRRCLSRVRSKQTVLRVFAEEEDNRNNWPNLLKQWSHKHMDYVLYVDVQRLKKVIQHFPSISEIRFDRHVFIANKEEVLNQLIQSVQHLSHFSFNFCGTEESVVTAFAKRFGQNLKSIEFCGLCDINRILKFCPNLLSVSEVQFNRLFDSEVVLLKNASKALNVIGVGDKELFSVFVRNNSKLTHLDVRLSLRTSSETSDVIAMMSELKDLEVLSIQLKDNEDYDRTMRNKVELIGQKCRRLKSFELDVICGQTLDGKHLCHAFRQFSPQLKKLSFRSTENQNTDRLDIHCFENCMNLSHLTIMSDQIDDHFFERFGSVFARLKRLKIFLKDDLTDKALESISRLTCLETLMIRRFGGHQLESITDSGVLMLIERCTRLHSLFIFNTTSVTETTVNGLCRKAVANPKVFYKYYLPGIAMFARSDVNYYRLNNICIAHNISVLERIKHRFN